ncbi:MAG: FGGY-family carbohydrate kinase [Chloroflexota bacterium]
MSGVETVLGIDLGTTQAKAGLITLDGALLGLGRAVYPVLTPTAGRAEQDPADWWTAIAAAVREALRTASAAGSRAEVRAISVVGQGPTTVCAAADGTPLRPAITWLDTRASAITAELEARLRVPSWQLGPLPHERWLAANEPAVHERTAAFLLPWDWLVLRLTGEAIRSVPPVSGHPADAVLAAGGGDPARFGRVVEWATPVGGLRPDAAAALGLAPGIPVIAGGNDALASFHGAGMAAPGDAIDTGGTSGGFAVYWSQRLEIPGTYRAASAIPGIWLYGGAMNATGKSLDWLRGLLDHTAQDPADLLAEAARTEPGADGLVFLPYLAGERSPIWDERARGVFAGLTLAHGRGHLARAMLEGAAFALRHVAEPIIDAGIEVRAMVVSGGTAATRLWSQVKADITGFPLAIPEVPETATLGAAVLAVLGLGAYPDAPAAMHAMVRIAERLEPRPALQARYDALYGVYRELYPATVGLVHRLGDIAGAR